MVARKKPVSKLKLEKETLEDLDVKARADRVRGGFLLPRNPGQLSVAAATCGAGSPPGRRTR